MTSEESELRDLAALGGWTEQPALIDRAPLVFRKGDKVVWAHSQGATCAELSGDGVTSVRYRNQRYYPTLADALGKES